MTDIETVIPTPVSEISPLSNQAVPVLDTSKTVISEVIFWNQTENNVSAGLAVLNKDQLHIAVYRTTDLPKNLKAEMAPGLTIVKPHEGMSFQINKRVLTPEVLPTETPASTEVAIEAAPAS
jgi:hypothetical protein